MLSCLLPQLTLSEAMVLLSDSPAPHTAPLMDLHLFGTSVPESTLITVEPQPFKYTIVT